MNTVIDPAMNNFFNLIYDRPPSLAEISETYFLDNKSISVQAATTQDNRTYIITANNPPRREYILLQEALKDLLQFDQETRIFLTDPSLEMNVFQEVELLPDQTLHPSNKIHGVSELAKSINRKK